MTITSEEAWVAIGLVGQAMFFGRFVVQWIASERAGRSVIPFAFWSSRRRGLIVLVMHLSARPGLHHRQHDGVVHLRPQYFLIVRERRNVALANPPGFAPDQGRCRAGA